MRSIGAGDGEIRMMFLGEVSLLGILGGAAGLGLGALAARLVGSRLFGAAIEPRAGVIPVVLAISLALCWSAVLLPLRRALAVQPAAALRGE
jgi:ABC-type antimicrobial peptide transport system permease subunit